MPIVIKHILECDEEVLSAQSKDALIEAAIIHLNDKRLYGSPLYKLILDKGMYTKVSRRSLRHEDNKYDKEYGFKGLGKVDAKQSLADNEVTVLCIDGTEVKIPRELFDRDYGD